MRRFTSHAIWVLLPLFTLNYCSANFGFGDPGLGDGRERFSVFYSEPGKDQDTMIDRKVDDELVRLIDGAERYMYFSVYNFNKTSVVQAVLRAFQRNIDVRVVGDIDEFYTSGYQTMYHSNINMTLGNANGIQHNKFAVVDDKYVFMGTGNISETDMVRNNNNWYIIQNDALVKLYKDEFLQMHNGLFASQKRQRAASTTIILNNSPLEVYFSPYQGDEAMDRIIALVESATTSIHYMIFAHTHDELNAAMIKMARQRGIPVYGIHDSTFVSGVSEEAPKIYSAGFNNSGTLQATGPFIRWDGNENTSIKNNPAHGGKMHCKTVLVDAGTPNARMATGSFNWSNNAINNNDENVIIVNQARVVNTIYEQFKGAWGIANDMALRVRLRGHTAAAGDVIISEVGWAGSSDGSSVDRGDDFIEIFNNTNNPIDLSHWAIQWGTNDKRNLYPVPDSHNWYYENLESCGVAGYTTALPNIICAGQVRLFYNKKPSAFAETGADEVITYNDQGAEINSSTGGSLSTEHFKFSGTKNFKISDASFKIRLYDKAMNLIDEAGDGEKAPAGAIVDYPTGGTFSTYSMERRGYNSGTQRFTTQQSGRLQSAWFTHPAAQPYTCSSRQDYSASAPPDGCLSKSAQTFSSAGYIYTAEANPQIKKVQAISTSQIRVTFDGNVSGAAGPNNCLSTGAITIRETEDPSSLCPTPGISSHSAGANSSEVILTLASAAMVSPTCRYSIGANATCLDSAGRRVGLIMAVATAGGVSTSLDGGTSFTNRTTANGLGANTIVSINRVGATDTDLNSTVFAATASGLGISVNGTLTFSNLTAGAGRLSSNNVRMADAWGNYYYVATDAGLSISSNAGATYALSTTTSGFGSNDIRAVRTYGSQVFVATANGLGISTNYGSSFINQTTANGLGSNDVRSIAFSGNRFFAATAAGLGVSIDGGTSFSNRTTASGLGSNDVQNVHVSGNLVLAATTGGISISTDGGTTFTNRSTANGLASNNVRSVSSVGDTILAATAAGLAVSTNGGTSFTNRTTSDGLGSNDVTGVTTSGELHLNGYTSSLATAIINEVRVTGTQTAAPFGDKDWVEVKATSNGSLRGLKLYYYNDEDLRLVYELGDIYATTGSIVAIGIAQGSFVQGDRTSGTLAYPLAIQLRDTTGFDATDGTFILTYCATGENDTVDTTRAECNLAYKGIQDTLVYTNRDGTLTKGMVQGPLSHFYYNLQSFWPISERPIFGLNDRTIQLAGACVAADSTTAENTAYLCTNSGGGVSRAAADLGTIRNAGKSAWKNYTASTAAAPAALSPAAANTAW
ncbi:phospholipase D-like domain-containing protein [Turneriella parva]|uniref:phospholipase D n=1 Tax=Turneriella parva (strain ATCC BAA-1111 / DSM 21527 / NCTC 11395 / H) TaxID=869212 RepID=I4B893_TURPD|nr:phospholipase D-like domain-containing protein [Turneriella parva]AFM13500.1 phospholipase D/Transphosphatidylase [Turneriella parva DSM 21527]